MTESKEVTSVVKESQQRANLSITFVFFPQCDDCGQNDLISVVVIVHLIVHKGFL